ncbi:Receptor-like protein kinase HERK 1 [Hordeum vulgare]|nr:Receptor-like protein kinase HERK 1 [Hordeum vulgare]
MAVHGRLLVLLLATVLPRAALAALSPGFQFQFFLACGANYSVSFPSNDFPTNTFVPDDAYLSPASAPAVSARFTPYSRPALHAAARADISAFSYRFPSPASPYTPPFVVLRLHFFPFFQATSSQYVINIFSARFNVSVSGHEYALMSSFSPPVNGAVKEFFVPRDLSGGDFHVKLHPGRCSSAFVNAIELLSAPDGDCCGVLVTPVEPWGPATLVRLHFCDYEVVSSVVGVSIVFNVYIAQAIGTPDLMPNDRATVSNKAFYMDYAAKAPSTGNLTVSIGLVLKSNGGGILNGLEIMRLPPVDLSSRRSNGQTKRTVLITWTNRWFGEGETSGMESVSRKLHIPLAKIKAATDSFHERNLIGVGGFGNVVQGRAL